MKTLLLFAGVGLLGLSVTLRADTHIYSANDDGTWSKTGRLSTAEGQLAIICAEGDCMPSSICGPCHTAAVDAKRYGAESQQRHASKYFPQSAYTLSEAQKVRVGKFEVTRKAGVLELLDAAGRRFKLPVGAVLVKGRDGRPSLLAYGGASGPQLVR